MMLEQETGEILTGKQLSISKKHWPWHWVSEITSLRAEAFLW